eukprot:CAMPEP_0172175180 /NCGR_PEP_ID=MMETSP1050-20130122/14074_1 /TAXON_ID=233186 /ORGANISM="Cryptomonas curvata, Strain CCAP979/52" /LENGTH=218 /DNA_ID=CAMNT_0012847233 /DNA_START=34 /DNA_END=690 /DNA_ORIENTATION=+
MMAHRRGIKSLVALGAVASVVLIFIISISTERSSMLQRFLILDDAPTNDDEGNQKLRHYLRASSDSIAYSCGGKEVAETCMLATETCVTSMQKKVHYTVRQSISKDMATCSCFQANGCSSSCNAAMMSMFGGYMSVADCPIDFGSSVYSPLSTISPYDFYGEDSYGSFYANPSFMVGTAGSFFRSANPGQAQVLAQIPRDELVVEVPTKVHMMRGRKV